MLLVFLGGWGGMHLSLWGLSLLSWRALCCACEWPLRVHWAGSRCIVRISFCLLTSYEPSNEDLGGCAWGRGLLLCGACELYVGKFDGAAVDAAPKVRPC